MPKVLHIVESFGLEGTSVVRTIAPLISALSSEGFEHEVWATGEDGPLSAYLQDHGAIAHALQWKRLERDVRGLVRFVRQLRRTRVDIIHQHTAHRSVRVAAKIMGNAALIAHVHGGEFRPLWYGMADRVIGCSKFVVARMSNLRPGVIYPGVKVPPPRVQMPGSGKFVVGAAARLVAEKGIECLLEGFALLKDVNNARLQIAGDGPEKAKLEKLAVTLGVDDRVEFLGWRNDLQEYLRDWDVFVHPTFHEGFGMANMEAMAAGLPVIATNVGGQNELIENGSNGILIQAGDPRALAEALRGLLGDPGKRDRLGLAARRHIEQDFNTQRFASEILEVYKAVIAERLRRTKRGPSATRCF